MKMNRRSFCGLAAAAGIANTISPAKVVHAEPNTVVDASPVGKLYELENDELSFTWFTDASALIFDRRNKTEWRMGPVALQDETSIDTGEVWVRTGRSICEQYPGRFTGRQEGSGITFRVIDQLRVERGSFHVIASLDGRWLNFTLLGIDS